MRDEELPVEGIEHLNDDEYGQSHGHGVGVHEDVAVNAREHPGLSWALHVVSLEHATQTSSSQHSKNHKSAKKLEPILIFFPYNRWG